MKVFLACLLIALVIALLMPVANSSAEPAAAFYQTNCVGELCLYPMQVTDTYPDTNINCTGINGSLVVTGTIGTGNRGCGFEYNLLNLPYDQRQYVTGDSLTHGVIGYRLTVSNYTNTGTNNWLGLPGPAASGSGATILNSNISDTIFATHPKTFCRYWGTSSSFINYDSECDNTDRINLNAPTDFYDMWAMYMQGHSSNPTGTWNATFNWVVRGDPDDCQVDNEWHFDSSMEEWAASHYDWLNSVGHDDPGSLRHLGTYNISSTQLTNLELQNKVGTNSLILSNGVTMSFWHRGQVDGISSNTVQLTVYYTDQTNDSVTVTADDSWTETTLTADNSKYISSFRFYSLTNGGLQHWIDDIVLSIPCDNYSHDGTPTPTSPPPTGTPAPTATPFPPPTPIPNPGGDPIPDPGGGGGSPTCYACPLPGLLDLFNVSRWLSWLGCVFRNVVTCILRSLLLSIINTLGGLLRFVFALISWLPGLSQGGVNWLLSICLIFLDIGVSVWDSFRSGFVGVLVSLFQGVLNLSLLQAIWRFVSFIPEGLGLLISLLTGLFDLLVAIAQSIAIFLDLLVEVVQLTFSALAADPIRIEDIILGEDNQPLSSISEGSFNTLLSTEGGNDAKIALLIIWGIQAVDAAGASMYLHVLLPAPFFAFVGINLLIWIMRQFEDISNMIGSS